MFITPGAIFGWKSDDNFHVGVILEVADDPKNYKVIHYDDHTIYIERLLDAVNRAGCNDVLFNTSMSIKRNNLSLISDETHMSRIRDKYERDHTLNSQDFINDCFRYDVLVHMIENNFSPEEQDILNAGYMIHLLTSLFGSTHMSSSIITETWDRDLTLDVTEWDRK